MATRRRSSRSCGEGHQSQYLSQICDQLYGVDVSVRAVRRASERCPGGKFTAGDPFAFRSGGMPTPVDLVAACEMIYYVKDIPAFLTRLSTLGRVCLVTYYRGQAPTLDPYFAALPGCQREFFQFDDTVWNAVWWRNTSNDE